MSEKNSIYFRVWGEGHPLLLIHDLGGSLQDWQLQIDFLKKYYQVIAYDLRGSGKSTPLKTAPTLEQMISDILVLLKHLAVEKPVQICGSGFGSMIAMSFALLYPARVCSLALLSPYGCYDYPDKIKQLLDAYAQPDMDARAESLLSLLYSLNFSSEVRQNSEMFDFFKSLLAGSDSAHTQNLTFQAELLKTIDLRSKAAQIKCPALILAGSEDALVPLSEMEFLRDQIPEAKLTVIPQAGHQLQTDSALRVNPLLYQFFKNNESHEK